MDEKVYPLFINKYDNSGSPSKYPVVNECEVDRRRNYSPFYEINIIIHVLLRYNDHVTNPF